MKFFCAILLFIAIAFSANATGERVTVELQNGTKQNANFLGIEKDTVKLGGIINGKFIVVRIPASRFKSIVNENGLNILATSADSIKIVKADSIKVDSSTNENIQATDSICDSINKTLPIKATFLDSIKEKHVYIALNSRPRDISISTQVDLLLARLIKESGVPIKFIYRSSIDSFMVSSKCSNAACIKDSLMQHGAASVYIGNVIAAVALDSVTVQMSRFPLNDSSVNVTTAQMNLSAIRFLGDAVINDKVAIFVSQLQGEVMPKRQNQKSYVYVETDPEGASINIGSGVDICKSPCAFVVPDSAKITLYAYWSVNNGLWGAKEIIQPMLSDTAKVSLKLKRVFPELRINTQPEGALIFAGSEPITAKSKPLGYAPGTYKIYEPGRATVQIRMLGFKDTLITVFAPPTEITDINVQLSQTTNVKEIAMQKDWAHERKKIFIGKTLMGVSIAPILLGALFTYLAVTDYDDADKIKEKLDTPSAGGKNYNKKVEKNSDLVHKGNRKMIIGGSLFGVGAALLSIGAVLTF